MSTKMELLFFFSSSVHPYNQATLSTLLLALIFDLDNKV